LKQKPTNEKRTIKIQKSKTINIQNLQKLYTHKSIKKHIPTNINKQKLNVQKTTQPKTTTHKTKTITTKNTHTHKNNPNTQNTQKKNK
jgi:hypothetical protein